METEDTPLSIAAAYMLGLGALAFGAGAIFVMIGLGLSANAPEACAEQTFATATGACRVPVLWIRMGAFASLGGAASALIALAYFGVKKLLRRRKRA